MSLTGTVSPAAVHPPPVSMGRLITAAVTAGLAAGFLYAPSLVLLVSPGMAEVEAIEHGRVMTGTPLVGTLTGGVVLALALSLMLTPVCRALGAPSLRTGLAAGLLALAALSLLPGTVGLNASLAQMVPGALAEQVRNGALWSNGILIGALATFIPLALRRYAP
ncbi:MAG: hypothetical protein ACE5FN_01530 [Leptospirillia bacterium]